MSKPGPSRTLAVTFDPQHNALNAFRLLFAALVLVSHAFAVAGLDLEPGFGGTTLGRWGVMGFFTISGYLITRSRVSARTMLDFAEARAARIIPGLVAALVVTAFVLAPLSAFIESGSTWDPLRAVTYVIRNAPLSPPKLHQEGIGDTLATVPLAGVWNGSLWTLFWEGLCYVAIAVGLTVLTQRRRQASLVVFVVLTAVAALGTTGVVRYPGVVGRALEVCAAFTAGAVAYFWSDRIRITLRTIGVLLALLTATIVSGTSVVLAPLPVILLLLPLSSAIRLHRFGSRYDASYGLYVYAWPVQQVTFLAFGATLPFAVLLVAQLLSALGMGYLSSFAVERPAQRWARRRRQRRTACSPQASRPLAELAGGTIGPR